MELLRELVQLQRQRGCLSNETLREVSRRRNVPLYRLEGLVGFYPLFRKQPGPPTRVDVCRDVVCRMAGAADATARLKQTLAGRDDVEVCEVSCLGRCDTAPAASIDDTPLAPLTLDQTRTVVERIQGRGTGERPPAAPAAERTWRCDPYPRPSERYGTLRRLLDQDEDVRAVCLHELQRSALRGMGGAGFPTAKKWELVADEPATPRYVICNADESEPGTFKDRAVLAELPHLVVEGMLLAGMTIGAERGIVYLRHEYGPEQERLEAEIARARAAGVLGDDVCGSGRAFDVEVFVSPGGYVLGEETALLEALEDERGEPRNKPPYPGRKGLWGRPTLINNVETFALATTIVNRGADWWAAQGREGHAGLKIVSVSGDVARPGVYEVPVGTPVAELIQRAGGVSEDRQLLAFLPGGASSNLLPASAADTPLDFDAMRRAGSMLGTGAVVVFARGRDLFDLATSVVRFFRNESCGKCVPCRVGSQRAVELLEGVQAGTVEHDQLAVLPELHDTLEQTSICGLGQVALAPILSTTKTFPNCVPGSSDPENSDGHQPEAD